MTLKRDAILDYPGLHGSKALVRVRRYETGAIVVQSAGPGLEDYQGLSVTNGMERIMAALFALGWTGFHIIIEHYPGKRYKEPTEKGNNFEFESFDQVTFSHWEPRAFKVGQQPIMAPRIGRWRSICRKEAEACAGEEIT